MKSFKIQTAVVSILVVAAVFLPSTGCTQKDNPQSSASISDKNAFTFTDDLGKSVSLYHKPERVISLMGSYAEVWLLSGGTLVGTTDDAINERGLVLPEEVSVVGTVKEPSSELILGLTSDFIILSTDVESHLKLDDTLTKADIPHAYFKVDEFEQYLNMLKICTDINERPELYKQNGLAIQAQIDSAANRTTKQLESGKKPPKVLLLRAMSTKVKALKSDHMVGIMLSDLSAENIADKHESLLEELSIETVMQEDPDIILVITMGDPAKAEETLQNVILSDPAWQSLSAVNEKRFFILPKNLFQYKPNAKWGESYEYLEEILYP